MCFETDLETVVQVFSTLTVNVSMLHSFTFQTDFLRFCLLPLRLLKIGVVFTFHCCFKFRFFLLLQHSDPPDTISCYI